MPKPSPPPSSPEVPSLSVPISSSCLKGRSKKDSVVQTVLKGRCPYCGKGALFQGFLRLASSCTQCGHSFASADPGDGPAFFVMTVVAFIVVGAAVAVEIQWAPPLWLHGVVWFPTILLLSVLLLRPTKALLIWIQYTHEAREGRLSDLSSSIKPPSSSLEKDSEKSAQKGAENTYETRDP